MAAKKGSVPELSYWPTGQLKKETRPDGSFTGYEYDIEGRATKVWASVPEPNAAQAAGPFGLSEQCALIKTIEYYRGCAMPSGSGQNLAWSGTTINSGAYVSGVRTYTYKGAGPVYYDMVYTSNARGQSEKTCFIDADDSTTRATSRYYTWRDRVRRITHPDGNSLDYTWDDHLRMTAEKLDGDTEKYEYDYCLCGALKRQRYIYTDSLAHSQTMDWTFTTDKLGRAKKLYHPYEIAVNSGDKYFSLLWEYDKAGRRTVYSDPTYGHICADTSGWTNHTEPSDETDWVFGEPERYLYGETGGLSAMGRVAGAEVRAGDGEPYFVKRDAAGRIASVIYPNKADTEKPEYELRYTYTNDGQLAQVATLYMGGAASGTYGPQTFVVQYFYDDAGRLVKKVVRNNEFSEATQYETSYEFDGMGRMVREKIAVYDTASKMMQVLQDKRTTYDLGGNATEVKFYDNSGWAFTETRTYARGYQLTGFSTTNAAGVIVISGGSYTYDTNNNLTGTKSLNVTRGATQLEYRAQWTFTYDRKNRLKSFTNTNAGYVRGNLWYDGKGRVWQRWNDNTNTSIWDGTLKRFVYNGGALVQEHEYTALNLMGSWVYTYDELTRDYLRQPAGIRQRERSGGNDTDYYMLLDGARLEGKAEREAASTSLAGREERTASLNQISGRTFENISNLATTLNFVEMYGGGTSGATAGFDGLVQRGGRHYLAGVGRHITPQGNNRYVSGADVGRLSSAGSRSLYPWLEEDYWMPQSGSGEPELPIPDECCRSVYQKGCRCWEEENCTGLCPGKRRQLGWFEFCCDAESCSCEAVAGLADRCGPLSCSDEPQGYDCTSSHCDWSFGFSGQCAIYNNPNILTACGGHLWSSFSAICMIGPCCACMTHHDSTLQSQIDSGYKIVWGCIADICRTGMTPNGGPLEIICEDQMNYEQLGLCSTGLLGFYSDKWPNTIFICANNIPDKTPAMLTLLEELLHMCGIPESEGPTDFGGVLSLECYGECYGE